MLDSCKCSNCGGFMTFDSSLGKLTCLSCKKEEIVENYQAQFEPYHSSNDTNIYEDDDARQYLCKQCHSTIVTDNRSAVSNCPFCGGQTSLGERLSGECAPTHIIPFKVTKREAVQAFKKWKRKLPFAPKDFPKKHEFREVTGLYIPVMCYDMRIQGETMINACHRERISTEEDKREETSCYHLYRKNDLLFRYMPISNSNNIGEEIFDRLCPFNFQQIKPFSPAYLEKHPAEKHIKTASEMMAIAKKKAEKYTEDYLLKSIKDYEDLAVDKKKYLTGNTAARYVLLPVWMVMYDYGNTEYIFAMNGETGKIACEPPKSWIKIGAGAGLIALASFLTLRIITLLLGGPLL